MEKYRVAIYFSKIFDVEAESETEAEDKAYADFRDSFNCIPMPDGFEVECLDGEEE